MNEDKDYRIPVRLMMDTELNSDEKLLYSIYHYFTFCGGLHCCKLTNESIGLRIGKKERSLQRLKASLTQKGLIKVNGIYTTALVNYYEMGDRSDTHKSDENKEVTDMTGGGDRSDTPEGDRSDTHNKES